MSKHISVAEDFTPYPFGRYRSEGEFSGEVFRDDILFPETKNDEHIEVNLDGVLGGLGSSFLEEVFGGMIRLHHFTPASLREKITITSDEDPSLVERAWDYVERASKK